MFESESWHNPLSLECLGRRLRSVPLFLLLVPYALGILLADSVVLAEWVLFVGYVVSVVAIEFLDKYRPVVVMAVAFVVLGFGYMMTNLMRPTCDIPDGGYVEAVVTIDQIPVERNGYRLSYGKVEAWVSDSVLVASDYDVVLWIRHDSVREGDRVQVHTKFNSRMSRFEPYDRLLRNRGYVGGMSINNRGVVAIEHHDQMSLQNRAIRKLERYMRDSMSHSTAEAMVVGSRRLEPKTLREAYSRTGLSHLMALSGLHLGIVVIVIQMLLSPMVLIHHGNRIRNIMVIIVLWLYVATSGASPSLVRAALMFSFLQLAMASSKRYNSLNSLSAALFVMLIYRPNYLYDISFQLSALAVIGIIVWGVPLMRRVAHYNTLVKMLLTTLIIGMVATLWTMPIVSHTFGNIPYLGVVVTPVAMLTAYAVVCCGIFALILPHPISLPFGWLMEQAARVQNGFVEWVAQWEWVTLNYQLSGVGAAIIYALFVLITSVLWSKCEKK